MVNHGHILVNYKRVNIPSYNVKVGDVITLAEKSRKVEMFTSNFISAALSVNYIEKVTKCFCGELIKIPNLDEIPIEVKYSKVLEFYSKN